MYIVEKVEINNNISSRLNPMQVIYHISLSILNSIFHSYINLAGSLEIENFILFNTTITVLVKNTTLQAIFI